MAPCPSPATMGISSNQGKRGRVILTLKCSKSENDGASCIAARFVPLEEPLPTVQLSTTVNGSGQSPEQLSVEPTTAEPPPRLKLVCKRAAVDKNNGKAIATKVTECKVDELDQIISGPDSEGNFLKHTSGQLEGEARLRQEEDPTTTEEEKTINSTQEGEPHNQQEEGPSNQQAEGPSNNQAAVPTTTAASNHNQETTRPRKSNRCRRIGVPTIPSDYAYGMMSVPEAQRQNAAQVTPIINALKRKRDRSDAQPADTTNDDLPTPSPAKIRRKSAPKTKKSTPTPSRKGKKRAVSTASETDSDSGVDCDTTSSRTSLHEQQSTKSPETGEEEEEASNANLPGSPPSTNPHYLVEDTRSLDERFPTLATFDMATMSEEDIDCARILLGMSRSSSMDWSRHENESRD